VAEPLPSPWLFPEPGDYVISGNSLSGVWLTDPDNYAWFRYRTPDAVVANTLYYYHVDGTLAPDWLAQCAVPKTPLHDNDIASGFEGVELRVTAFDCDQSWIYPGEGKTRGVYALHGAILRPDTLRERLHLAPAQPVSEFASRHLEPTRQTYRQWSYRSVPAFALYEWEMDQAPVPSSEVWVASVDAVPGTLLDGASVRAPLSLSGPLTFLGAIGYSQEHEGKALEVETWWQVDEGPITRPFSIMAHLLTKDGTVLGVADGLGAFPPMLAAEDIIVQRHLFPGSTAGPQIYLRTGAYWVDVMERWPVQDVSGGDTLFVPLDLP